jgi:hypothetical protein
MHHAVLDDWLLHLHAYDKDQCLGFPEKHHAIELARLISAA